jgi:hypothetical protein
MATITPTPVNKGAVIKMTWANMANGDVGSAFPFTEWADRSVQVTGVFGATGNLRWEGSNDGGANYATLTDPQGNALDFTSTKIETITEICELVRPRVTSGDGTTALTVSLIARNARSSRGG